MLRLPVETIILHCTGKTIHNDASAEKRMLHFCLQQHGIVVKM